MRVALVHSFHHEHVPSGENVVVRAQVDALRAAGHEVTLVAQSNDERGRRPGYRLEAAATTVTGIGPDPTAELRRVRPDVVHVHNLFPNFGTRWLGRWPGPLVATLHNLRPLCAAGTLLRDGRRCTDCRTDPWAGVRHACFQQSRVATLPLAVAGRRGAAAHPVVRRADRLVAISHRVVDEYVAAGVDRARFAVVPNAVPDVAPAASVPPARPRWLFVGRLSAEKGVRELLDVWPDGVDLDVVGDGELAADLRARALPPTVRLLGGRTNAEVRALLGRYTGLVVPSLWAEAGPPLTYVEALAAGVPAVAWAGNGAADDVAAQGTGAVVDRAPTTAALAAALDGVYRDRDRLAARCRAAYETRFSTGTWIDDLLGVYTDARRDAGGK
ncbi:glycosyltransferase involved in cell wall biosynthesis [Geodermatophilus normandii]|uniref:Glycosyltransferase involved in cell wall biosynthesis n=1 Tax=Geodermatophilus normandii TaxID=1137989 RepID=A0A317QEX2_9ACTN|nr:glycosyltransferase family 4 protein [Geodermatophilus normandii]PWW21892.1 glycosyltransferase involved in cell wall biosynthesis [Geodermatophilus normandii]